VKTGCVTGGAETDYAFKSCGLSQMRAGAKSLEAA
jgi:hypothetical protein